MTKKCVLLLGHGYVICQMGSGLSLLATSIRHHHGQASGHQASGIIITGQDGGSEHTDIATLCPLFGLLLPLRVAC